MVGKGTKSNPTYWRTVIAFTSWIAALYILGLGLDGTYVTDQMVACSLALCALGFPFALRDDEYRGWTSHWNKTLVLDVGFPLLLLSLAYTTGSLPGIDPPSSREPRRAKAVLAQVLYYGRSPADEVAGRVTHALALLRAHPPITKDHDAATSGAEFERAWACAESFWSEFRERPPRKGEVSVFFFTNKRQELIRMLTKCQTMIPSCNDEGTRCSYKLKGSNVTFRKREGRWFMR